MIELEEYTLTKIMSINNANLLKKYFDELENYLDRIDFPHFNRQMGKCLTLQKLNRKKKEKRYNYDYCNCK